MGLFKKEEYMKDLETLVNLDSGSSDIEGLNRVADFLCGKYEEIGLSPRRIALGPDKRPYVEVLTHPEAEEVDVLDGLASLGNGLLDVTRNLTNHKVEHIATLHVALLVRTHITILVHNTLLQGLWC